MKMEQLALHSDLKVHTVGGNPPKRAMTKQNCTQEIKVRIIKSKQANKNPQTQKQMMVRQFLKKSRDDMPNSAQNFETTKYKNWWRDASRDIDRLMETEIVRSVCT